MYQVLKISGNDNVAVVPQALEKGELIQVAGEEETYTLQEDIPAGHKVALKDFEVGEPVIKYGIPIGRMKERAEAGSWIHCHNLEDTTEELCGRYCEEYQKGKTIAAYPRKYGQFGVANYIMIFSTSLSANRYAEALSDRTGAIWMVCDKRELEDGRLSALTQEVIVQTAENPNIYASIILDSGIWEYPQLAEKLEQSGRTVIYQKLDEAEGDTVVKKLEDRIEQWKKEITGLKREPVSIEGLTISVHCAGSDWTTALSGNPALGIAADHLVKAGGYVFMDEWAGFPGSEHLLAEHAATREIGNAIIEKVKETRARYLRETGKTVEETNPYPSNKEGGISTLVEKSTGNIRKAGTSLIQGILKPGDKPGLPGVYLLDQSCGAPASTGVYGALSGCHINVQVTGVGYIYDEIPHLLDIRVTGNHDSFQKEEYRLDFDAGEALCGKSLEKVGEELFHCILSVAEGTYIPKNEKEKSRAFLMNYPGDSMGGEEYILVDTYQEKHKQKTDAVKI